jgi:hypothetical protein
VIAFAGGTYYAYPMMIQVANTILSWDKAANRRQSLEELKGHLLRVMNGMLTQITDPLIPAEHPDALFLFAGFSWKSQRFVLWTLHFDSDLGRFTFRPATRWRGGNTPKVLALVGDEREEAKMRLTELLRAEDRLQGGGFDMEPLEVLLQMIDSPLFRSISGPVQIVKVYRNLQVVPFVVQRGGVRSLFGRRLLDYEESDAFPMLVL